MIYIVPLESYEERYTEQWSRWIPKALDKLDYRFSTINGKSITSTIEHGDVLDVYGTHYWKFSQLQELILKIRKGDIKDGDTLWFADLWFPGLEALFYIRDMMGINFKITGVMHAGTWDVADFTCRNGMRRWGKHIESGWLDQIEEVYVGSDFHKNLIIDNCLDDSVAYELQRKIKVTGLFFDPFDARQEGFKKENIVVFPHRLDDEKHPEMFDILAEDMADTFPDWKFIKTKDVCKTKKDYYELLAKAKIGISFAAQETFGYAMLECLANDCEVLVPDKLSYSTMSIYEGRRYTNNTDLEHRLHKLISKYEENGSNYGPCAFVDICHDYAPERIVAKMFRK